MEEARAALPRLQANLQEILEHLRRGEIEQALAVHRAELRLNSATSKCTSTIFAACAFKMVHLCR